MSTVDRNSENNHDSVIVPEYVKTWKKYYRQTMVQLQVKRVSTRIFHKKVRFVPKEIKKREIGLDATQELIRQIIVEGKPAMVARFGSNEARCCAEGIGILYGHKRSFSPKILNLMHLNAGVFPYGEKMALRFSEILAEAASNVDLLGYWESFMQNYLTLEVCRNDVAITQLGSLEPYYSATPWTSALKGKKVLVIHPFKESIESQYKKRTLLFENPDMLPEFQLTVVKAVQTIAGEKDERFENWEQALNYMYEEAMRQDFDVAIIGCGAYGMPLAAMLKKAGKIAIHLGGATQLLFGIKGNRWDNTIGKTLYNEHWVRPMESEIPSASRKIENGCYW